MRRRLALTAVSAAILLLTACSSGGSAEESRIAVPAGQGVVPPGWAVQQAPGFTIAVPPEWEPRAEEIRLAPEAALEVGVPYTGQPVALPVLLGFVERERVGPLDVREQLLRLQLDQGLPADATLSAATRVDVAGATGAVFLDAVYSTEAGESVTGAPLAAVTVRQRELLVDAPGLPKYGLRFAAPDEDFPEELWRQLLGSIVVTPGDPGPTSSPPAGG